MILILNYCIFFSIMMLFFQKRLALVLLLKLEVFILMLCVMIFFFLQSLFLGSFLLSSSFLAMAVSAATMGLSVFIMNMRLGGANQLTWSMLTTE